MNLLIGFLMGMMLTAGYNALEARNEAPEPVNDVTSAEIIAAYKEGAKDVLKLNPIDPRLESTCINLWGMRQ
jgi:hypothetical protein